MTCDRCSEFEAENDSLRDELHDVRVELADARSTLQAYQQHPSQRRVPIPADYAPGVIPGTLELLVDACDPRGMKRPKLTVVR
jgi:hypothetical protein